MKEKLMEIRSLLEQMTVNGERNAVIYVTCLRELQALINKGGDQHGNIHAES